MNFAKFLKTPFLTEHVLGLVLPLTLTREHTVKSEIKLKESDIIQILIRMKVTKIKERIFKKISEVFSNREVN